MVATDAPIATHVGATVLRNGGNAVDAAIATAFALAVVLPDAGNLGGGGFLVVHMGDGREAALDFRETAPGAATRDMYIGASGHADDRSITGLARGRSTRLGRRPVGGAPALRIASVGGAHRTGDRACRARVRDRLGLRACDS